MDEVDVVNGRNVLGMGCGVGGVSAGCVGTRVEGRVGGIETRESAAEEEGGE